MKNYEVFEHTADIGIRVKGKDLKELFKNTALAMFDIMAEKKLHAARCAASGGTPPFGGVTLHAKKIIVKQRADNLEELFINWLNELLSLSATQGLLFSDFKIDKLDAGNLRATVSGDNIKNYKVNTEIKAATYHELKIEKTESGWQTEIIFDV